MPSVTAKRRCPELIFVKPRFDVYREVSQQIRAIFADYTDLIEPLEPRRSLSRRDRGPARARHGAGDRRGNPRAGSARRPASPHRPASPTASSSPSSPPTRTSPTACASSRPSGRRPSSPPCRSRASTASARSPRARWKRSGIHDRRRPRRSGASPQLEAHFGSSGRWYWRICRGIDEREVKPDRPYKSVSAERTFDEDLRDPERLAARADADRRLCLGRGSSAPKSQGGP